MSTSDRARANLFRGPLNCGAGVVHVDGGERLWLTLPSGGELKGHAALVFSQTEIEALLRQRPAARGR
jgi:hypothetical protein